MKNIDLGQGITILANIGVIAGIAFLAYELRQNTLATELVAAQGFLEAAGSTNRLMVENPNLTEIIAKDIEGEELSRAERLQLNNGFLELLRAWEINHWQFERGALDAELWRGYNNMAANIFANNETAEEYWRQRLDYFSPGFNELVESTIAARRAR
jgi:hypothetical protein